MKNLEEKSRRLDSDLKRSLEHMTLSLQKLREERRKEEVKDRDLAEQLTITNQKLQEITKKVILNDYIYNLYFIRLI